MTINYTTNLSLAEPVTGTESGTWGDDVNKGLTDYLDISIAGTLALTSASFTANALTLANTTGSSSSNGITTTTAQYYILKLSSLAAAVTITAPSSSKTYLVYNSDSTYSATIKASGQSGVSVVAGERALVFFNGTDYVKASSTVLTNFTGIVLPANGGTGVANGTNNTITFTGNYTLGLTLTGNTAVTFPTSGTLLTTAGSGSSLTFGTGTLSLGGNLTTSGAFATTVTVTAATSVTLPTTGTLGYQNIPQNSQSTAYTTVAADAGYCIFHPASDANARTFTIAANASVPYALGTVIQFINMTSQAVTIAINSDTLTWAQGGGTGSRTLAQYGVANCIKIGTTQWLLTGTNVT